MLRGGGSMVGLSEAEVLGLVERMNEEEHRTSSGQLIRVEERDWRWLTGIGLFGHPLIRALEREVRREIGMA